MPISSMINCKNYADIQWKWTKYINVSVCQTSGNANGMYSINYIVSHLFRRYDKLGKFVSTMNHIFYSNI